MKCPKCKAKMFSDTWYPADTSCPICGYYIPAAIKEFVPMDKKTMIGVAKDKGSIRKIRPCPVKGCDGTMKLDSTQPMCKKCKGKMISWRKTQQMTLPPIIVMNGEWVLREMVNVEVVE